MIKEGDEILGVIVGGSKCGKTTLSGALVSMLWRQHRLRSIVFDPFHPKHRRTWGATAWVTADLAAFKRAVLGTRDCAVFWDESTTTLKKTSHEDTAFFTQIRHRHKAFYSIGHDFTVISPTMRGNLTDAFVFRQSGKRCGDWVDLFADDDLAQCNTLVKREFFHKVAFEPVRRLKPTLQELARIETLLAKASV